MNFLKNRFLASVLLLAVVFGVTPLVAGDQLEDKVEEVSDSIYEWKGLWQRLEECNDAAGNLVSIAVDYPGVVSETEALRFAQHEMADALLDEPDDMYTANVALAPAFQDLYQKLLEVNLSDEDRRAVESYQNTFNGAQRSLETAAQEYNERVRAFGFNTYYHFPARMFARWFDIDMPAYYSADGINSTGGTPGTSGTIGIGGIRVPEAPEAPEAPTAPDAPDLDETINNFVDGITDYVNHTVHDALDDAFEH